MTTLLFFEMSNEHQSLREVLPDELWEGVSRSHDFGDERLNGKVWQSSFISISIDISGKRPNMVDVNKLMSDWIDQERRTIVEARDAKSQIWFRLHATLEDDEGWPIVCFDHELLSELGGLGIDFEITVDLV